MSSLPAPTPVHHPDTLTVSSSGPAALVPTVAACLGRWATLATLAALVPRFTKVEGLASMERPVWRQEGGEEFLFYTATQHWLVGPDPNTTIGCIHSEGVFLETIPVTGWR